MSDAAGHVPGKRERLAAGVARSGLLPLLAACRRLLRGDLRILAYHRVVERIDAYVGPDDPIHQLLGECVVERLKQTRWMLRLLDKIEARLSSEP